MLNLKPILSIAIVFAMLTATQVSAQQPSQRYPSVRKSEQAARASWSPTRGRSTAAANSFDQRVVVDSVNGRASDDLVPTTVRRASAKQSAVRQVSHRTPSNANHRSQVRQTGHVIGGRLPAATRSVATEINRSPITDAPVVDGNAYGSNIVDGGVYGGEVIDGGQLSEYPLDGQINLSPFSGNSCGCGASSCGAEPSCGCGGCDSMPCGGCKTGCGGNCSMCGELQGDRAWRPAITLRLPQDGWASFEALNWYQDGMELPPLVTTSDGDDIPRAEAGVLGNPATRVLFGGDDILDDRFDGFRFRGGIWLDRCHTWGVGMEYFHIGEETETFSATSSGDPILARPFFNTTTGLEDSELVAFPGVVSGTVNARATSELYGGGFHFRRLRCCQEGCKKWLFCGCDEHYCSRTEAMFGYRYLQLDEQIEISESLVGTNPQGNFNLYDSFKTRNQFNGFDLGWKHRVTRGYWTYDALVRLAFGNTRQTVRINGQTSIQAPGDSEPTTSVGGLLAQTSNIGTYQQDEFSVVPEINANIGYQLTDHLKATVGYTFIYWSNVVRPGHIISTDLNTGLLPPAVTPATGVARPAFNFDTTDYWVQGVSYGLEYRW